jgi:hypothetical protein
VTLIIAAGTRTDTRTDADALAHWIVKNYPLSHKGKDETVTPSALDVSRTGEITAKVDALSESLLAALETDSKIIEAAWRRSPRFYNDNYIDLACFTKKGGQPSPPPAGYCKRAPTRSLQ